MKQRKYIFRLGGIALVGLRRLFLFSVSFSSVCGSAGKWIPPTKLKTISTFRKRLPFVFFAAPKGSRISIPVWPRAFRSASRQPFYSPLSTAFGRRVSGDSHIGAVCQRGTPLTVKPVLKICPAKFITAVLCRSI